MRWFAALVCAVVIGFSGLVFAFQFNSNFYAIYEAPGTNSNTIIYILPKNSFLILGVELPTPIMFMPQTPGFMAILAPDGTLGSFSQVNNNANNLPANAVLSSYKLFGGDFDGNGTPDFLLQGAGTRYTYVLISDVSGTPQIYYSFGTGLSTASYPAINVVDADQNGRADIVANGSLTYLSSTYGSWFEVAGSGGSSGGSLNLEVGSTEGAFRVNESGAATYSVPIMAVPGTAGVTPQISLSYSSQNGNGLVGKGWSIGGLSSIMRCRQTKQQDGVPKPITWTAEDRFCLDGQRLIIQNGSYGAVGSTYRTEIDSYSLITAVGGAAGNPNYFKVERKDGSVSYFGTAPNDTDTDGKLNNTNGGTLVWALRKFEDSVANSIWFIYTNDVNGHRIAQIRYAYGSATTSTSNHASINFTYETTRPDSISSYVSGYPFKTNARLKSINVFNEGAQVRSYSLSYIAATEQNKISRVSSIQECGGTSCLPATQFEWAADFKGFTATSTGVSGIGLQSDQGLAATAFGDINGDGCTDMVAIVSDSDLDGDADDELHYYISDCSKLTRATFTDASDVRHFDGEGGQIQMLDYNGDGRSDVAVYHPNFGSWRIYLSTPQGDAWRLASAPIDTGITTKIATFRDTNSDGLADAMFSPTPDGVSATTLYSRELQRFPAGTANHGDSSGEAYQFGPTLQWAVPTDFQQSVSNLQQISSMLLRADPSQDFNGDGIIDYYRNSGKYCWSVPGLGAGCFSIPAILYQASPDRSLQVLTPYSPGPFISRTADVNGDGIPDLLFMKSQVVNNAITPDGISRLAFGTGTGYAPAVELAAPCGVNMDSPLGFTELIDYNGDGFSDLV